MVRSSVLPGLLDNIHPYRHDHVGCGRRVADPCLAPAPTPMSVMRERVADGTDLATAMLDVPSQLAKRLDSMNGPPERRRRDRRYEGLMARGNWRWATECSRSRNGN